MIGKAQAIKKSHFLSFYYYISSIMFIILSIESVSSLGKKHLLDVALFSGFTL